ncbi:hypothetical protein Dsin_012647 [Dipteronia sinensis]|uniref:Alcohol dehydrogenase-like C-terminal domain-containing protein n=1 Tax=Dipteronia sinensis TaxID=43782 RepID=A0AAE0E8N5_9ROSI|nr:hypothetical protein Dsin_012647 [Dipteronia sinensis]
MAAQFLLRLCFKVEPGHTILVHAAAGGVGSLLCQWANALGATVIGTGLAKEKAAQAKDDGCHHVIIYKEEDFVARVNEITSGKGVDGVYDSVGKDTFQEDDAQVEIESEKSIDGQDSIVKAARPQGRYKKREREREREESLSMDIPQRILKEIFHGENESEAWHVEAPIL